MNQTLQGVVRWITAFFKFFEQKADSQWWVRIKAESPEYTYYFGPFETREIAQEKLPGFVEDLHNEAAHISDCTVEFCTPPQPTIRGNHQPPRLMSDFPA